MKAQYPILEFYDANLGAALFNFADIPDELSGGVFIQQLDYSDAIDYLITASDQVDEKILKEDESGKEHKYYKVYVNDVGRLKKELGEFLLGLLESALEYDEHIELCPVCKRINTIGYDTCEHHLGLQADGVHSLPDDIDKPLEELSSLVVDDFGESLEIFASKHKKYKKIAQAAIESEDPVSILGELTEILHGDYLDANTSLSSGFGYQLYANDLEGLYAAIAEVSEMVDLFKKENP